MPDAPAFAQPDEEPLVCVLALDDSRGGDGILATKDIQTIADLKGKSVAVLRGSISHFYLIVLLKEAGLSEADIEAVDLSAEDAGQAFMMQEVDAAVTNDPYLSQARNAEHGHVLTDTTEQPGLLVDCLMTRADVFSDRKGDFQAVARAWDAAVRYVEAHPDDANEIMARHLGGGLEDPEAFARDPKGRGLLRRRQKSRILRHSGRTRADLRDHAAGDRRLVEHWDAEHAGFARRRDQARHLGRSSASARSRT